MKSFGDLEVGDKIYVIIEEDLDSLETYEITGIEKTKDYLVFFLNLHQINVLLEERDRFFIESDISFVDLVVSDKELIDFIRKAPRKRD